jgi:hypothetical protein
MNHRFQKIGQKTMLLLFLIGMGAILSAQDLHYPGSPSWAYTGKMKKISLFNGTDLNQWKVVGFGEWVVKNGLMVGTKSKADTDWGHLVSKAKFKDAIIRLEYKVNEGNSGVYVRSSVGGDFECLGVQVDAGANDGSCMVVGEKEWHWLKNSPVDKGQAKLGEWNTMVIYLKGSNIRTVVNGKQISEYIDLPEEDLPEKGRIAFQLHQGDFANNIYIKAIDVFIPK